MSTQSYDLDRFVEAQESVYPRVVSELAAGAKRSHWMWFIFPQIAGLGISAMAQRYAIGSRAEAVAYLGHPVLGTRLIDARSSFSPSPARASTTSSARPTTPNSVRR
jgi:uncharacterized protein (DUF1810 family)